MSHQDKQRIFDEYAKTKGYEDWQNLLHKEPVNKLPNHTFAACDLVQEEQQKIIAGKANLIHTEGGITTREIYRYSRVIGNNCEIFSIHIPSIINPENVIK